jgi:hypothetical protein
MYQPNGVSLGETTKRNNSARALSGVEGRGRYAVGEADSPNHGAINTAQHRSMFIRVHPDRLIPRFA